jgi:hypothetical protein
MKMYGEMKVWFYALLIKALDGGEWSVFRSGHFTPGRNGR